jgi:Protein of unknown function (DUF3300)
MRKALYRSVAMVAALSLAVPPPSFAQTPPVTGAEAAAAYNNEQLDALLAPIALYPDALLAQVMMASTYPLEVVAAARWQKANASVTGDALTQALAPQTWDPSVKSLVPFPQVLAMLNSKLDWTQQLGYAFSTQQADVMNSVQRLRLQAQQAGYLKTTEQQTVVVEKSIIVIEPASPQIVYVPVYSPTVVYGVWRYPAYPPVYIPPPPGYVVGNAFVAGMAFATGAVVVGSLWGWARPSWYGGSVNVNVNRYNNINVNRPPINSAVWRPPAGGVGGRPIRPPSGPIGTPGRPPQPAGAPNRPPAGRPPVNTGGQRPGAPPQGGNSQRPPAPKPPASTPRPGTPPSRGNVSSSRPAAATPPRPTGAGRPANRPSPAARPAQPQVQSRPSNGGRGAAAPRPAGGSGGSRPPIRNQ